MPPTAGAAVTVKRILGYSFSIESVFIRNDEREVPHSC
jgi:hypothetical protein